MPYYPLCGYKIDNYDLYGIWKIKVKKVTGLFQFLSRKGEISQSWPDTDGEESFTNANDIWFEGRDVIMWCYIKADSFTELQTLLKAFKHQLEKSGLRTLAVPYTSTTFSLIYVKGSDLDMLTPKTNVNQYIGEFWVQFREPIPVRS